MKTQPLSVAILTTGRFHVADLARELDRHGCEVTFYSDVPRWRIKGFLSPKVKVVSFFWPLLPLIALHRIAPQYFREISDRYLNMATDFLMSIFLKRCDVFIGMSGICMTSAVAARSRFGAKIVLERGSRHILSQKEILDDISRQFAGSWERVSDWTVARELRGYALADLVSVPSGHAERSFLERGFAKEKLFLNPYGVDTRMFSPVNGRSEVARRTAIMVGTWSYQKGCDLLADAFGPLGANHFLIHVGAKGDAPMPKGQPWFCHFDPVPQARLVEFYSRAAVLVLPSRQDGFGVVLVQALASGLVLIGSNRTGGADLRAVISDPRRVFEVTPDASAIRKGLIQAFALAQEALPPIRSEDLNALSWESYGKRYYHRLRELTEEVAVSQKFAGAK